MQCSCGNDIADARAALGYRTCLDCGQAAATKEIIAKQRSVLPMHKGNYTYPGKGAQAVWFVRDISTMRRG